MKFLAITLIVHGPDPVTGVWKSTHARFREVIDNAVLAEELGFDGFGVGERHERPFISAAPPVVLSHIAARTSRIRLFTAVTTLSLLDPVRAAEDYATLDNLADGRLELIIGKGNGSAQRRESVEVAAAGGDPLFSANVTNDIEPYAELIDFYRERWAAHGHDPAAAVVGAGTAGYYATERSQDALDAYRPIYEFQRGVAQRAGLPHPWSGYEDYVARSSALIGSPEQVIDKVHRYHERFGHTVMHLHADAGGLTDTQHRDSLTLFRDRIAPVLNRSIPDPPWPAPAPDLIGAIA